MWFNVQDLNVADAGASKVDLGTIATNTDRGLSDHKTPAKDLDGFTKSAEVGIGGMATSLDGRAMFIANLHDKSIYGIPLPLDDPGATPGYAVKIPTPVGVTTSSSGRCPPTRAGSISGMWTPAADLAKRRHPSA